MLHVEPTVGLARSGEQPDRFESEDAEFHAKVADAFLRIADEHPERYVVVDSSTSPENVHRQVRLALDRILRASAPPRR
jgi:dTMP kinase